MKTKLGLLVCGTLLSLTGCDLVFGLEQPVQGMGGAGGAGAAGGTGSAGGAGGSGGAGGDECVQATNATPGERLLIHESFEGTCWAGDAMASCELGTCTLASCCGDTSAMMRGSLYRDMPGYSLSAGDAVRVRASGQDADGSARIYVEDVASLNLSDSVNDDTFTLDEAQVGVNFGLGNDDSMETLELDCASLTHTPSVGVELMPDAGFEVGGEGWFLSRGELQIVGSVEAPVMCGSKELKIACPPGETSCVLRQNVCLPTEAGTLSLWVAVSASDGALPIPTLNGTSVQMSELVDSHPLGATLEWFTFNEEILLDGVANPAAVELLLAVEPGATVRVDCTSATFRSEAEEQ